MPRNNSIHSILIVGSGPIVIGQACEFDYSGSQACKVLKEDGYRVVLINSNPATIMTDPETADAIYLEPIDAEYIEKIIIKEASLGHPIDAVLPTIGGQTALNVSLQLHKNGTLKKHNIRLIGASVNAIEKAENRDKFKTAMDELGYEMSSATAVSTLIQAYEVLGNISYPVVIRPSFTLGGSGGSIAYNKTEFDAMVINALNLSPTRQVLLEKSLLGWKEFELEVMKDSAGNVVIVCSIENFDPMGIHTGDSITVAPQQTLSDKMYQKLRNMSIAIIKKIGVDTGGANIQYAVNPSSEQVMVIEMNPRVSRSSALASKATGFPIAKIAAKLAVGYHLSELQNDITKSTPACFEPSLDYVVTKLPRFAFEKFREAPRTLGIQMQSVGETMSIGRTFPESLQKACRALEAGKHGFEGMYFSYKNLQNKTKQDISVMAKDASKQLSIAKSNTSNNHYLRLYYLKDLFFFGYSIEQLYRLTKIDPWFLSGLQDIFHAEMAYWGRKLNSITHTEMQTLKSLGFSDIQLATFLLDNNGKSSHPSHIEKKRTELSVHPVYKVVDTCSAEFAAETPYFYSTYEEEDELQSFLQKLTPQNLPSSAQNKNKGQNKGLVLILGSGPNRIGQGIEFDYMCVKACQWLSANGYCSVMMNCNPETVSTDYDVSNLLFFEPLTKEDVLELLRRLKPLGIIIHLGGQTPLNLAKHLQSEKVPILGTSASSIFAAEDRKIFKAMLEQLQFLQPRSKTVTQLSETEAAIKKIGFPLMLRPSFVLGGQSMRIVENKEELEKYFSQAVKASNGNPVLIDEFLLDAQEVDVDLISDGETAIVCGLLEHIEQAGVHSGDSACIFPAKNISLPIQKKIMEQCKVLAIKIGVRGFLNVQMAVKGEDIYFIEANPRGSRTVPFISKCMNHNWVGAAMHVMLGGKLRSADIAASYQMHTFHYTFLKEAVLPFNKFYQEDIILGPEMKSTGEVIGVGKNAAEAFFKTQLGAGLGLPKPQDGSVLITLHEKNVSRIVPMCLPLTKAGYKILATAGTHKMLSENGVTCEVIGKLEDQRPNLKDSIINGQISLIFNLPLSEDERQNDREIRVLARKNKISVFTNLAAMEVCAKALVESLERSFHVYSISRDYNKE